MTSMIFPFASAARAGSANTIVAVQRKRRMNMGRTLSLLFFALSAAAQSPSAGWRTIETPHFRVHYPRQFEAWSMRAASRLEAIRAEVAKEVGFTPEQVVDVLVANPFAEANGSAWPLLDT